MKKFVHPTKFITDDYTVILKPLNSVNEFDMKQRAPDIDIKMEKNETNWSTKKRKIPRIIFTVLEAVLKQDLSYVIDSQYPQWDLIT